jgi:hypothetical protein
MPARDTYHDVVVLALERDGWTITADPFWLPYGDRDFYVDLAAERTVAAEKAGRKIAVEIKSFIGESPMRDLELALGQYMLYVGILEDSEPDRQLYLAVPRDIYEAVFVSRVGQLALRVAHIRLVTFEVDPERIVRWID